jgi:hypothetical protein
MGQVDVLLPYAVSRQPVVCLYMLDAVSMILHHEI